MAAKKNEGKAAPAGKSAASKKGSAAKASTKKAVAVPAQPTQAETKAKAPETRKKGTPVREM